MLTPAAHITRSERTITPSSHDPSGSQPYGVPADRWVEFSCEALRAHVRASEPVGCEETGYLVEFEIDCDPSLLADEISASVPGRESTATLLAAAVLAYTRHRLTAEAAGHRSIRSELDGMPVEDGSGDLAATTPSQWLELVFGQLSDEVPSVDDGQDSEFVDWLSDDFLTAFDDQGVLAALLARTLLNYTLERVRAAPGRWLHPQVPTSRPGVEVDAGMAELIEAVWASGIATQFSCECTVDHCPSSDVERGKAMLLFDSLEGASRFLSGLSDELWRLAHGYDMTRIVLTLAPRHDGVPSMSYQRAIVEFPAADLPLITRAWQCRRE